MIATLTGATALCLGLAGAVPSRVPVTHFTLEWTHSVEKTRWWERWEVTTAGIRPVEARISGSGAGMEVPAGAVRAGQGWTYRPDMPPQGRVEMADSDFSAPLELCAADRCRPLSAWVGRREGDTRPVVLAACP